MSVKSAFVRCKRDIANFLTVREATSEDESCVASLLLNSFDTTYAEKLPQAVLSEDRKRDLQDVNARRKGGGVWILEMGNRLIGTFSLLLPSSQLSESWLPDMATLRCVAVAPEYHGLGLSERLLQEADDRVRLWGLKGICLHIVKEATSVGRVYERYGYLRDRRGDREFLGLSLSGYIRPLSVDLIQRMG